MEWYQWISLLGVPALATAAIKYTLSQIKSVRNGVQALLRAQMIADYNHYMEKGYAPIYAKDNFENCWKQYHALGVNGVMDDLHNKFLQLPTTRGDDKGEVKNEP